MRVYGLVSHACIIFWPESHCDCEANGRQCVHVKRGIARALTHRSNTLNAPNKKKSNNDSSQIGIKCLRLSGTHVHNGDYDNSSVSFTSPVSCVRSTVFLYFSSLCLSPLLCCVSSLIPFFLTRFINCAYQPRNSAVSASHTHNTNAHMVTCNGY